MRSLRLTPRTASGARSCVLVIGRHVDAMQATVHINAPATLVWEILAAVDLYCAWAPFTTAMAMTGSLEPGQSIVESVELAPGQRHRAQLVVVTHVSPPSSATGGVGELRWDSRQWGSAAVLHSVRTQTVTPDGSGGAGGCTYASTEVMRGALRPLVLCLYGGTVRRGFEAFAKALKERAEQHVGVP